MDQRSLLIVLLALLAFLLFFPLLTVGVMMPTMGGWEGGHMWSEGWSGAGALWMWLFMWLVVLMFLLGIGYVIYRGISGFNASADPALEELRLAYARGELSDEEFEERYARLTHEK